MLRKSFREHPRWWLVVLAPTFLAIETACSISDGTPANASNQVPITKAQAKEFLRTGDKKVRAFRGGVQINPVSALKTADTAATAATAGTTIYAYGNYTGKVNLSLPAGVHGMGGFTKGKLKAGVRLAYVSSSTAVKGTGTVLIKFAARGAGSVCLRMSWSSDPTQQKAKGSFDILGGTGRAARVRDKGKFAGVQPTPFVAKGEIALFGTPSVGAARRIPSGCGTIKPPPPPKTINASVVLKGYAASVGAPGANATLYPDQSTISDPTLCRPGGGLYAVFDYTGPAAVTTLQLGIFTPTNSTPRNVSPKPGLNDVLLASRPRNGSYGVKGQLVANSAGAISGKTVVSSGASVTAGC